MCSSIFILLWILLYECEWIGVHGCMSMIVLALYTSLIQNPVSHEMKLFITELAVVVLTIPIKDKKIPFNMLQETKQIIRISLPVVALGQTSWFAKASG